MKKGPQTCQVIILIKSCFLVSGLFVKSIFHSKCHISQSFALQIGWAIYLKRTGDVLVVPWHKNVIGVGGREDGWRLCEVGCQGAMGAFNVVLYLCEISNDQKWQIPYGFESRHNQHANKQSAHRHRLHRVMHTHYGTTRQTNVRQMKQRPFNLLACVYFYKPTRPRSLYCVTRRFNSSVDAAETFSSPLLPLRFNCKLFIDSLIKELAQVAFTEFSIKLGFWTLFCKMLGENFCCELELFK